MTKLSRRSPHKHTVKRHKRRGKWVEKFERGRGDPRLHKISKRVVGRDTKITRGVIERIHSTRSRRSRIQDERKRAPIGSPKMWVSAPNEYDIAGIDTPGGFGSKSSQISAKPYTNAQLSINQIGGLYRVHVWDKEGNIHNEKFIFETKEEALKFIAKVKADSKKVKGVEATYNLATGWMRIVFDEKPSREILNELKDAGFRYRPRSRAWVAKQDSHREELLEALAGEVKEVDIAVDHAAKAEFYQTKADKLREEASDTYDKAKKKMDFIPIGQPILVGHHSERRHRSDLKKIDRGMKKSFELGDKAEKAQRTALSHLAKSEGKENPVTILNRIEKMEKDIVRIKNWSVDDTGDELAKSKKQIARIQRRLDHERVKYKASGGIAADKIVFKVGMKVQTRNGPALINKISKKSVRVKLLTDAKSLQGPPWDNLKMDKKHILGIL